MHVLHTTSNGTHYVKQGSRGGFAIYTTDRTLVAEQCTYHDALYWADHMDAEAYAAHVNAQADAAEAHDYKG